MGRPGRAPTPTKLKMLKGETRRSRLGGGDPEPPDAPMVAPDWFALDVRQVWDRTVATLEAMDLVRPADTEALAVYCQAVVNYAKAAQALERTGILLRGTDGQVIRNPANAVLRDNGNMIRFLAREFGLTPAGRATLGQMRPPVDTRDAARLLS